MCTNRSGGIARWAALALLLATPPAAALGDAARDEAVGRLLGVAFGAEEQAPAATGRALFEAVLAQPLFERAEVGPFDLYVYRSGSLAKARDASELLARAAEGLGPAAQVLTRQLARPDEPGQPAALVAGRRFPILLASDADGYRQLVALLDRCEDEGLSGWKPVNPVWCAANLAAEVTRTWEAQVFHLGHRAVTAQGDAWLAHGLGYGALAHVSNRLLRQGAWGNVPPWLAQGLIDELDIQAYGQAWVGGESYTVETAGWSREGWSGFVPQGTSPPPPVTGPPATLAVTVKKTGNPWEQRDASASRHWGDLVADRKSEAPASFAFMARHESFFPRDRAYARCVVHLVLDAPPADAPGLLGALDRAGRTPSSGMPDADPLPVVFARALGGLPELDALEAQSLQDTLTALGRDALADRVRALGAEEMLAVADHRAQAEWLYRHPSFSTAARRELFDLILEAEYWQQLRAWELVGERLDAAASAALKASTRYPKAEKERAKVAAAFASALRAPAGGGR